MSGEIFTLFLKPVNNLKVKLTSLAEILHSKSTPENILIKFHQTQQNFNHPPDW